jgi:3-phenylpropionate/cinnamic acid dioxygenase small subunit
VSARPEIENTLFRCAWAFDMDRMDLIGECFAEDAVVDFPAATMAGTKEGRPAIVEQMDALRDVFRRLGLMQWHVLTNVFIVEELDGRAEVKTFFTSIRTDSEGAPMVNSVGYYDDVLVLDGGAWRIKARRVVPAAELPVPPR